MRSELQEGVLIGSPSPTPRHQRAIMRLGVHLHGALPDEYDTIPEVDVVLDAAFPPTVRRPDLEGTPRLEALTLVDGRNVGDWVTGTYTSDGPFPMTVDLDSLV